MFFGYFIPEVWYILQFLFHFFQIRVLRHLIEVQTQFKEKKHKQQTESKLKETEEKYNLKSEQVLSDDSEDENSQDKDDDDDNDDDDDARSIADLTDSG